MSIKFNDLEIFIAIVEALRSPLVTEDTMVSGRLSVFAPVDFMSRVLDKHLGEFSRCYPSLGGNKPTTDALGASGGHVV
jgi:DNA-binding transcriptional LysR family regulator